MSFLSDVFSGNFGNLGNDLSPSNIFSDTASSFQNQPGWAQGLEIGGTALLGGALLAPALAGGAGALGAADAAAGGFDLATIGPGVDAAGGLAAADTAAGGGVLSDAAIGDLLTSPGASAFADVGNTGITGAGAGASVAPGTGGLANIGAIDPTLANSSLATIDPGLGQAGPTFADTFTSTDLGGGNFAAAPGAGGTAPFTPGATPAAGPTDPFGGVPSAFQTGSPPTAFPGATGGAVPAGGVAATPSSPGILDKIGNFVTSPAGKGLTTVAGLGGLGYNLYSGYEQNQQVKQLAQDEAARTQQLDQLASQAQKAAAPLISNGQTLINYLNTGTLPKGLQEFVQQQTASAKAARIQSASSLGQSTDPKFNTALAQDLAAIDRQSTMLTTQLEEQLQTAGNQMIQTANQLINTGASTTNIAAQLPIMVQNLDIKLAQLTSQSLMSFAAALNGRTPGGGQNLSGININVTSPTGPTATA